MSGRPVVVFYHGSKTENGTSWPIESFIKRDGAKWHLAGRVCNGICHGVSQSFKTLKAAREYLCADVYTGHGGPVHTEWRRTDGVLCGRAIDLPSPGPASGDLGAGPLLLGPHGQEVDDRD
jgi:hypothetical protein